ncbi:uncharacterized protein LOC110008273 [Amborella trichopoda]|uniref:uncharacterized protein LOC110008273 n=1 Tax=Amborella trichopoda TaxID=13333 RepID=UPI0009BF562D|nr:uncharacterized protein LOC110008273 [Amborella trichopoda]|eukprot:XP_020530450.1 uncharacterized protein LOC110008273 [Amborella trichopoda]
MLPAGSLRSWNPHFKRALTNQESANFAALAAKLQACFLAPSRSDRIIWTPAPSGEFTVSSFFRSLSFPLTLPLAPTAKAAQAWTSFAPPKINIFSWLTLSQRVLTVDRLQRRGIPIPKQCVMCLPAEKTNNHLLLHCPYAHNLWGAILRHFNVQWVLPAEVTSFLSLVQPFPWHKEGILLWKSAVAAALWALWIERNNRIFRGDFSLWPKVLNKLKSTIIFWATNHHYFKGVSSSAFSQDWSSVLQFHRTRLPRASRWNLHPRDSLNLTSTAAL